MFESLTLAAFLVPFTSYHFDRHGENQVNPGLAAEFRVAEQPESISYAVGAYRNSLDRNTVFAQAVWTPVRTNVVQMGASLGVGSGYGSPVIGGGFVRITPRGPDHAGLHLLVVPPVPGYSAAVVGFSLYIPVRP